MSRRREQRESVILRATQEVLSRGLADPRVRGLITVTGVRLTEDGKQAFVSISVLPEDRQELTMHGLRAAAKHIRRDVADRIRIREMPAMEFRLDESIKKQGEVLAAINRASTELAASDRDADDDRPAPLETEPGDGNDGRRPAQEAPSQTEGEA